MSGTADVVVVGGGIAGVTVAYELARRGRSVRIVEERRIAAGASGRNTGTLLHQTEPEVAAMLRASEASYRELAGGEVPFAMTRREQLLLARDDAQWAVASVKADAIGAQGVPVERLDAASLRAALPVLADGVAGGYALAGAHTVDTEAATHAFATAARAAGARLTSGTRVVAVETRGGRVSGLLTDAGRIAADAVVVATGPWLADLVPGAAVRAGRGWLMRTAPLPFALPWIVEEVSWPDQAVLGAAARPLPLADLAAGRVDVEVGACFLLCPLPGGDAFLGASLATSLRDAVEGVDAPQRLARRALAAAPGLAGTVAIVRAWWGLRPMTPDGLPLVGPTDVEGLYVHGGHGSLGMQAAPATARWLAAAMHGEPADPVLGALRPDRFTTDRQEAA